MYKATAFFILLLRSTIIPDFIILRSSYRLALEIIKSSLEALARARIVRTSNRDY